MSISLKRKSMRTQAKANIAWAFSCTRSGRTIKIKNGISGTPYTNGARMGAPVRERVRSRAHEDSETLFLIASEPAKWNYFIFCCSAKCIPAANTSRGKTRLYFYADLYGSSNSASNRIAIRLIRDKLKIYILHILKDPCIMFIR